MLGEELSFLFCAERAREIDYTGSVAVARIDGEKATRMMNTCWWCAKARAKDARKEVYRGSSFGPG
jgi:hypothetical protein